MKKGLKIQMIEEYMKEQGLSKTKFCRLCKIGAGSLKKVLSEDYSVSLGVVVKIAKQIGVHIADFFV